MVVTMNTAVGENSPPGEGTPPPLQQHGDSGNQDRNTPEATTTETLQGPKDISASSHLEEHNNRNTPRDTSTSSNSRIRSHSRDKTQHSVAISGDHNKNKSQSARAHSEDPTQRAHQGTGQSSGTQKGVNQTTQQDSSESQEESSTTSAQKRDKKRDRGNRSTSVTPIARAETAPARRGARGHQQAEGNMSRNWFSLSTLKGGPLKARTTI